MDKMFHDRVGNATTKGSYEFIKTFKPLPWQRPPWRDYESPVMLLTGAAGGGKSRIAAEKLHGYLLRYPGATGLVLRKTRQSMKVSTLLFLQKQIIGDDPRVTHVGDSNLFRYSNGSVLIYSGMKDANQREWIRSIGQDGGVDIAWMEEATQFEEQDFNELLARMRGTAAPWQQIILTTNPDAPGHWINRRLILSGEASVYYSQADDNPHNSDGYITSLDKLTGVQHSRLVKGQWVIGSGQVFDTWKDSYHPQSGEDNGGSVTLSAEYDPNGGEVIWAVDDGYAGELDKKSGMFTSRSHPRVILMCQRRDNGILACFDESYAVKKLAKEHLIEALAICANRSYALPQYMVHDRAAQAIGGQIREMGFSTRFNAPSVDESIKVARSWIGQDENKIRRFIVHPRCFHLRYEMASYCYDDNSGRVVKELDNGPDALRYLVWDEVEGLSRTVDIATWNDAELEQYIKEQMSKDRSFFEQGDIDIATYAGA